MTDKQHLQDPEERRRTVGIDAPWEDKSGIERLKRDSHGLRGQVAEELNDASTPNVSEDSYQLMKHFGMYQQDNRDTRIERKRAKLDKEWIFMIRTKAAGGVMTAEQYLAMDDVAGKYCNGTLRLTTRQTVQFHGTVKGDVASLITDMNRVYLSTYGACGDVVRNTMADPVADISADPIYSAAPEMIALAKQISDRYLPKSCGYYDIFINDENLTEELAPKASRDETENIYGDTYMPRKFKIGLTVPENNSVDIFSQDLGLVMLRNPDGTLRGYNIMIGGGLGHSHNKPETYPRAASAVCFATPEQVLETAHAVITIQRDYGNRADRKNARLKYLVDAVGLEWFKAELERRTGYTLAPPVEIGEHDWGYDDHVGWHDQKDGLRYVGIFIENGRIKDEDGKPQRTIIRQIVEKFRPQVRITPQQNLVLSHIKPEDQDEIEQMLRGAAISSGNGWLSTLRRGEVSCVALPTCGLALAEAERTTPHLITKLEELGFGNERVSIRVSGCPNSCSRAPMAEIGLLGRAPGKYNVYLGGDYEGTRTNKLWKETVKYEDLPEVLGEILGRWRKEREEGEAFGDWVLRVGVV